MKNIENRRILKFLALIRSEDIDVVDEATNQDKLSSFTEVVLTNILSNAKKFGVTKKKNETLEESLITPIEYRDKKITYLESKLIELFFTRKNEPCILRINSSGKVVDYPTSENLLILDINKIISDTFSDAPVSNKPFTLEGLDNGETQALKLIRNDDYHAVHLIKNKGEIERIEANERIDTKTRIVDILQDAKCQDIQIKRNLGKIAHISRTIKTKII